MVRHMGNYLLTRQNPNFMKTSLKAAGAQGWHIRPLIYSGGATLAYCLDGQIRKASQGTRTLGTLIRRLFTRSQNGEKLTSQVFVSEAENLTAMPMESFYADYVEGVKSLPVQACTADQGRSILVQGYDVFVDGRRALP